MKNSGIVTRFAPSPTGFLHIGGVRTALFSYIYARQARGKFILRIEDTDKERNREEWTRGLVEDLEWLGLEYDLFAKQSERTKEYKKYLEKMVKDGKAYISKEETKKEGERDEVIRFKNPNKKINFNDLIRGEIEIDTSDLGDFVIAKSMDEPLYHLAVVVDDFEMGITHVIRAEEHLSNTPRQILIQEAIGAGRPAYAHLPLVLAEDRSKLSKRKHGETVSLTYYRNKGYLPEAIINFVALLGWNPGTDQEILSMDDLIDQFKIDKVQKGGAIFNVEKLNWINRKYMETMKEKDFLRMAKEFAPNTLSDDDLEKIMPLLKERMSYFGEIGDLLLGELSFISPVPEYNKKSLMWKQEKDINTTKEYLKNVIEILYKIKEKEFTKEKIKSALWPYAEEKGRGNVLWPVRFALSGKEKSPDPFVMSEILEKDETLKRLNRAYEAI